MKILLIGNGAREHVMAEKLAEDAELYAIMSKKNPAITQLSKEYWICDIQNTDEVANIIKGKEFDLGFSSPDATLAAGISDVLEKGGMLVASPTKAASRIEWDKSFMRNLLKDHKIEGAIKYEIVDNAKDAERVIKDYGDVAIKPIGLTGGKGVKVSGDHFDDAPGALDYITEVLKKDDNVLIEEKLVGQEFSFQAFSDGSHISMMPPVQDHKRAYLGDSGPNTGGMGSYSTGKLLPFLEESDLEMAKRIMKGTIHALKKEGSPFKGVLYGQFMANGNSVKVVEFNARFGDPEAMNVLPLLKNSLTNVLLSMADGQLSPAEFSNESTVVKYLVPEGYPVSPKKDAEIVVNDLGLEECGAKLYYASVYEDGGKIFTTGSRAFGILGKAENIEDAEKIAEKGCNFVKGPVWHREDIGTKKLIDKRIENMDTLRGKN